ncbi:MAG: hypothetical protein ABR552_07770 [Actinomycetota bacterium]
MEEQRRVYQFSKWQVFTIAAALVVAAMVLPVGVMAATGQYVNIRDYANTNGNGQARVVNQKLGTELCDIGTTSYTTSTCARVFGGKFQVGSRPTTEAVTLFHYLSGGLSQMLVGAGKHFAITSITLNDENSAADVVAIGPKESPAADCSGGFFDPAHSSVILRDAASSTTHVTYPMPLVVGPCTFIYDPYGSSSNLSYSIVGFYF